MYNIFLKETLSQAHNNTGHVIADASFLRNLSSSLGMPERLESFLFKADFLAYSHFQPYWGGSPRVANLCCRQTTTAATQRPWLPAKGGNPLTPSPESHSCAVPSSHQLCTEPSPSCRCGNTGEHRSVLCGGFANVFCQVNELKRLCNQLDSTSECPEEGGTMWLEVRGCAYRGEGEKKDCPFFVVFFLTEESCLPQL